MFRFKLHFLISFITFGISIIAYSIIVVKRIHPISVAPQSLNVSPILNLQESELIPPIHTEKITQDRDLSLYNFGGNHEVFDNSREFIWKHWQDKKRGYIVVGSKNNELINRAHIFIEPDNNGQWQIAIRWQRFHGTDDFLAVVEDSPKIRTIKRKRVVKCIGKRNYLFFLDKDGIEVLSF